MERGLRFMNAILNLSEYPPIVCFSIYVAGFLLSAFLGLGARNLFGRVVSWRWMRVISGRLSLRRDPLNIEAKRFLSLPWLAVAIAGSNVAHSSPFALTALVTLIFVLRFLYSDAVTRFDGVVLRWRRETPVKLFKSATTRDSEFCKRVFNCAKLLGRQTRAVELDLRLFVYLLLSLAAVFLEWGGTCFLLSGLSLELLLAYGPLAVSPAKKWGALILFGFVTFLAALPQWNVLVPILKCCDVIFACLALVFYRPAPEGRTADSLPYVESHALSPSKLSISLANLDLGLPLGGRVPRASRAHPLWFRPWAPGRFWGALRTLDILAAVVFFAISRA